MAIQQWDSLYHFSRYIARPGWNKGGKFSLAVQAIRVGGMRIGGVSDLLQEGRNVIRSFMLGRAKMNLQATTFQFVLVRIFGADQDTESVRQGRCHRVQRPPRIGHHGHLIPVACNLRALLGHGAG